MMRKKSSILKIIIISSISVLMVACAGPKIKQDVVMPAKESGMKSVKKIAVLGFGGDQNQEFAIKLESFLANVKVKSRPYFTVVDRKALDAIIAEQKMVSGSGLFNEKDAVKLGELSGVDTVMNGFIKWPRMETTSFYEKRSICVQADSKGKCTKWGSKKVKCIQQVSKFDATVKAISVQKGDVVFSKNYIGTARNKYCSDSGRQETPSELAEAASGSVMSQMRKDVAPYVVTMTIELMNGDDSVLDDNKSANKLFESGLEFANNKRMDRACEKFRAAIAIYDKSPALYHNLGVCAEIDGDLDKALRLHKHADNLLDKPNKNISKALVRVDRKLKNEKSVASQLR